jgi:hypothetical protein
VEEFLFVHLVGSAGSRREIVVVQHWAEEFRDRKPTH